MKKKKQYIPESQLEPEDLEQENRRGFPPVPLKIITYEIELKVRVIGITESNTVVSRRKKNRK
jgi:hypothetical protein